MTDADRDFDRNDALPEDDEQERTMPLVGVSDDLPEAADLDLESMKDGGRIFNHGTALIIIVAAIAGGAFYAMRATQGELSAGEDTATAQARIEQAIAQLARPQEMAEDNPLRQDNRRELSNDTDSLIGLFTDDIARRQVPLEYVQKDPFVLYRPGRRQDGDDEDEKRVITREEVEAPFLARERQLRRQVERLNISGVVGNTASIGGGNVRAGDKLDQLTVVGISRQGVVLESDPLRIELKTDGRQVSEGDDVFGFTVISATDDGMVLQADPLRFQLQVNGEIEALHRSLIQDR